ncbi:MAG: GNAT family N-acetyltransferase [Paludibacteraceae bacterium]|nr:GNAT family N-acetyltransferase [Paludibacteraceae bacterium]MBR4841411.1 GNAT family N-acetyltransferase [Paludibacteraceae bacterium]
MNQDQEIEIMVADERHIAYVDTILDTIAKAAKVRGTGIAKRDPEYVKMKIREGKAVIALCGDDFAGFSYIETWENKKYVTTSGLIVPEKYRGRGLARRIKHVTFTLARKRWPEAKIFSLTSGAAVMKLNTALGYLPVTFADLTEDESFWKGCQGCVNYDVLQRTDRRYCICTGMLFDPKEPMCVEAAERELAKDPNVKNIVING